MENISIQEKIKVYSQPTTSLETAIIKFMNAMEGNLNVELKVCDNAKVQFPITVKNPELNNPFNWTMEYGSLRNHKEEFANYFNETQKDLTLNWVAAYGEKQAIEAYQKDGTISKGLMKGTGYCHPIRIEDANWYREHIIKDNHKYGTFVTHWAPKDNIPYYVPDPSVKKCYAVCYREEEMQDKTDILKTFGQFIIDHADFDCFAH